MLFLIGVFAYMCLSLGVAWRFDLPINVEKTDWYFYNSSIR